MTRMKRLLASLLLAAAASVANASAANAQPNALTSAERAAGWRLLFDGTSFAGWRGLGYDSVPSAHWRIKNGTIMKIASGNVPKIADGQPASGGDLMSIETFKNFELTWEFKLTPKSNTGIKYNVSEEFSLKNAGNHAALGWEFQLQDDINGDDISNPTHLTASLYDMIASNAVPLTNPIGEWNSARLVFNGNSIKTSSNYGQFISLHSRH